MDSADRQLAASLFYFLPLSLSFFFSLHSAPVAPAAASLAGPVPNEKVARVSNQNKQSPICLIETFEVVNGVEPPSKLFCSPPVGGEHKPVMDMMDSDEG